MQGNDSHPLQPDYSDTIESMKAWRDVLQQRISSGVESASIHATTIDLLSRDIDRLEQPKRQPDRIPAQRPAAETHPLRVLVIDDDADFLLEIADLLSRSDYSCDTAASGDEAKRTIARHRPDVILLDYRLADKSGLDLLDELQFLMPDETRCEFIVISGFPSVDSVVRALRRRVCDYLTKPFSPESLRSSLREASRIHAQRFEERSNSAALQSGLDRVDGMLSRLEAQFAAARPHLTGGT